MSTTVDNRVVKLVFDNDDFEQHVQDTMDTLKEFEDALNFDGATAGLEQVEDAAGKLDISSIGDKADEQASHVEGSIGEAASSISKIDTAASNVDMTAIGAGAAAEASKVADASGEMTGDLGKIDTSVNNLDFSGIGSSVEKERSRVTNATSDMASSIDSIGTSVDNLDFTPMGSGAERAGYSVQNAAADAAASIDRVDDAASNADFSAMSSSAEKAVGEINTAASGVNLSPILSAIQEVSTGFDGMSAIAFGALSGIGGKVTDLVTNKLAGLGNAIVNPIKEGFGEYETQIGSIQTILANTGRDFDSDEDIQEVNSALSELNHYADDTIYKFTDMTQAIGSFTAAGLDLEQATRAVQGLANVAAFSGASMMDYHGILPQVAQALTSGTVQLMDWRSFENRQMGGKGVYSFFANMAEHMAGAGLIGGNADEQAAIQEVAKMLQSGEISMRSSLNEDESPFSGWFDSSVLSEGLMAFTFDVSKANEAERAAMEEHLKTLGYGENEMKEVFRLAEIARRSATEVRTFSQLMDTTAEAIGSNWTNVWMNFIGDFKQATTTFTFLSQTLSSGVDAVLGGVVHFSEVFKNSGAGKILFGDAQYAKDANGEFVKVWDTQTEQFKRVEGALDHLVEAISKPLRAIGDALADVFDIDDDALGIAIVGISQSISSFTESLIISDDAALALYDIVHGLGSVFKMAITIVADVVAIFLKFVDAARVLTDPLGDIALAIGGLVGKLLTAFADEFFIIRDAVIRVLQPLFQAGDSIGRLVKIFFDWADIPGIIDNVGDLLVELLHTLFEFIDIPGKLQAFANFIGEITGWNKAVEESNRVFEETGRRLNVADIWVQNLLKNPVAKFFKDIADAITGTVKNVFDTIHNFFGDGFFNEEVLNEEGEVVETKFGRINEILQNFRTKLSEVGNVLGIVGNTIVTVFTTAGGIIVGFVGGIGSLALAIGGLVSRLGEMFIAWEPIQELGQKLENFKNGAIQFFLSIPDKIANMASVISAKSNEMKNSFGGVVEWFQNTLNYFNTVSAEQFVQDVRTKFTDIVTGIKSTFDSLRNLTPQDVVDSITNFVHTIPTTISTALQGMMSTLDDSSLDTINNVLVKLFSLDPERATSIQSTYVMFMNGVKAKVNGFTRWIQGIADESNTIPQFIANLFIEIASVVATKFTELKTNISNGIASITPESLVSGIQTTFQGALSGIAQGIAGALGAFGNLFSPELGTSLENGFMAHIYWPIRTAFGILMSWFNGIAQDSDSIPEFIGNIFIKIKDTIANKISEIKTSFENFNAIDAVLSAFKGIESWSDEHLAPFFDTVGGVFAGRFPELSQKIDEGMYSMKGRVIYGSLGIASEVQDSLDKTDSIPTFIADIFGKIVQAVKDGFKNIVKIVSEFKPEDLWNALSGFVTKIQEKFNELFPDLSPKVNRAFNIIRWFFDSLSQNAGTWGELASTIGNALKNGIANGIETIGDVLGKIGGVIGDTIQKILDKLSTISGPVGDVFGKLSTKFSEIRESASEGAKTLPDKFKEIFGGIKNPIDTALENMKNFWDGFKIISIPEEVLNFIEPIKTWIGDKLSNMVDYIKGVPEKVSKIIDEFKKSPQKLGELIDEAKKVLTQENFNYVTNIIESLLLIKTALHTSKLIGNISKLTATVNNYFKSKAFVELASGFKDLGKAFIEVAAALFIISMIPDPQGAANILWEVVGMFAAVEIISGVLKKFKLTGGSDSLLNMAKAFGLFCIDMLAVMYVIEKLTAFDWAANQTGITAMGVCIGALVIAAIALNKFGGNAEGLENAAKAMMWMSAAASLLAYIITKCSKEVDLPMATGVTLIIGAALAGFWALVKFTNATDAAVTAKALMKYSEAIAILSACIWVLSSLDPVAMGVGAIAVDSMIACLFVITKFTQANDLMTAAKAIDVFSVGVGVMAYALYQLADKDWEHLSAAAGSIDMLLLGLLALVTLTEDHDLMQAAKAIDVFSVGVGIMAYSLYQLSDKDWTGLSAAAGSIDMLLLGLLALVTLTEDHDLMTSAAAIDLFSAGVGVMAYSLYQLAEKDWAGLSAAAAAIDLVVAAFGALVMFTDGKDLIATAGAMDMFSLAVGVLAYSLYQLAQVDAAALTNAAGALSQILIPFELLAGILSIPVLAEGASIVLPGLAAAFTGLGIAVLGIGEGLNLAMDALQKLVVMGPMLLAFVVGISPHLGEFAIAAVELTALGAALVVFGAGLVVFGAGAITAGAGLTLISTGIREFLTLIADLPELLAGAGQTILDAILAFPQTIASGIEGIQTWWNESALPFITGLLDTIGPVITGFFEGAGEFISTTIIPGLTSAFEGIKSWWETEVVPRIPELTKSASDGISGAFTQFVGWLTTEGWPMIQSKAGEFWTWLTETAIPKITEIGGSIISKAGEVLTNIGNWITNEGWPKLKEKAQEFWKWWNETGFPKVLEIGGGLLKGLGEIIGNIGHWILTEGIPKLFKFLGDIVHWFFTEGIPKLGEIGGKLLEWLGGLLTSFGSWMMTDGIPAVGDAIGDIMEEAGKLGGKLLDWVLDIPSHIKEGIDDIWSKITDIGGNIVDGILEGMSNISPTAIWDSICTMGDTIMESVKSFFGIESPSKLMKEEVGKYIPQGVGAGMAAYADAATKAAEELGRETATGLNDGLNAIGPQSERDFTMTARVSPVLDAAAFDTFSADLQNDLTKIFEGVSYQNDIVQKVSIETKEAAKTLENTIIRQFQAMMDHSEEMSTAIVQNINDGSTEIKNEIITLGDQYLRTMGVRLDTGALVGELAPAMDQALGERQNMTSRGVY